MVRIRVFGQSPRLRYRHRRNFSELPAPPRSRFAPATLQDEAFGEHQCADALLESARAYGQAGDNAKSKAAYQALLAIWKDADGDSDLFRLAKAEAP